MSIGRYPFTIARGRWFLLCLLLLVPLTACRRDHSSTSSGPPSPDGDVISAQYRGELLSYAVDNLNRLEEFDSADAVEQILERLNPRAETKSAASDSLLAVWPEPEMLRQIVERLNQWVRSQSPPADWKPDPMLASLPKSVADLPALKALRRTEFSRFDGYALQEAVWLRDITRWGQGEAAESLERAKSLFDWTVRNIQLEASSPRQIPQFPWETLPLRTRHRQRSGLGLHPSLPTGRHRRGHTRPGGGAGSRPRGSSENGSRGKG